MEVFSLLKFWRNAAGGGGTDSSVADTFSDVDFSTSSSNEIRKHVDEDSDLEDSFFDLVFSSPDSDTKKEKYSTTSTVKINGDDDCSVKSKLDGRESKSKFMESPTDVFFKTKLLQSESKANTKPQSPISLLKSSPKLRVFMLGFSKPKLVKTEVSCASMDSSAPNQKFSSKRFTVDYKIEEVPIASLLTRDNSLRAKLRTEKLEVETVRNDHEQSKRFSKDGVQKYLNLIKPLYVKASKRYNDKTRFPEQSRSVTPSSSPAAAQVFSPREEKQGSRGAVLREVRKHLGKSRSESRSLTGKVVPSTVGRRDDSLLQDGIQSAILHCKRSYNSSSQGCSVLSRSGSAPAHGKSERNSMDEEKRSSI